MIVAIIFSGLLIVGIIKHFMDKPQVAIFSADRKTTQGKQPNIISHTFGSKKQEGKINTFVVGPAIGPQNPSGQE